MAISVRALSLPALFMTAFAILALLVAVNGGLGLVALDRGISSERGFQERLSHLQDVREQVLMVRLSALQVLSASETTLAQFLKTHNESMATADREVADIGVSQPTIAAWKEGLDAAISLRVEFKTKLAYQQLTGPCKEAHQALLAAMEIQSEALRVEGTLNGEMNRKKVTGTIVALSLGGILCALGFGWWLSRLIGTPAKQMQEVLLNAAQGHLVHDVPTNAPGAIGSMAGSLGNFIGDLRGRITAIRNEAGAVNVAVGNLHSAGSELTGSAAELLVQAGDAAKIAGSLSGYMTTVATASEQMHHSVQETVRIIGDASTSVSRAEGLTAVTVQRMQALSAAVQEVDDILTLITSVAAQTNLLALNAAIEAASAGSAGRGFAVVANEVKELAKRTSEASGDIGRRLERMRADSASTSNALTDIVSTVAEVRRFQEQAGAAVIHQAAANEEITKTVQQATKVTSQIADQSSTVAGTARHIEETGKALETYADDLGTVCTTLNANLKRFSV